MKARRKHGRLVGVMAALAVMAATFGVRPAQAQQPEPPPEIVPQPATLPTPPAPPAPDPSTLESAVPQEAATTTESAAQPAAQPAAQAAMIKRGFLPRIGKPPAALPTPPANRNDIRAYINYFRTWAGVPAISLDATLNNNCWLHGRYMAESNELTHNENTSNPWYTPQGQVCAQNGNAWMGSAFYQPYWQPYHAIEGWMNSVAHRMWMLYPTTPVFGFGFYTAANNRAGSALDVLSHFNSAADAAYPRWPVRYPGPGQNDVPASNYAITIFWRYFGPTPTLSSASLRTAAGADVAHTATTSLDAGHKGVKITPNAALARNTTYVVSLAGTYNGAPYSYTWSFKTVP